MKVSVLTPSYNYGRFLGDCLASVANQTYGDIEHIVADGASTDSTLDVLQRAEGVRWLSEPDRGQSHALNKALAMASGDIIGWLNADDAYADRRSVAAAVRVFEAHPEVGAVYGHSLLINAENRVLQLMWAPPFAQRMLKYMTLFTQPAVFLRRSVIPELFVREDLQFVMDRDLWLRLRNETVFRGVDIAVGIDRHHGARKVMSEAFLKERNAYQSSPWVGVLPRPVEKAIKVSLRMSAIPKAWRLQRHLQPAIDLHFDPPGAFALRQLLLPRSHMPEGLATSGAAIRARGA